MDYLTHLITSFGYLGYLILFVIIFLESFPFTFFLPGDSLLFTTGFLASQGYFNFYILFGIIFVASTVGYILSYYMGEKVRALILNSNDRYWFKKRHIIYTDEFYKKYGVKTLIIGRFIPVVRSFAPTLAGTADMNIKKFINYTILGGLLWISLVTSVGFYLGKRIPNAHLYLTPIVIGIVLVSFIPAIIEYIHTKTKDRHNKKHD